jgi:hypothetical protein
MTFRPASLRNLGLTLLLLLLTAPRAVQAQVPPPGFVGPMLPPAAPPTAPTSKHGSMAPGVWLEDMTYTLRLSYSKTITVSKHNPKLAYVGSFDGYVWKTIDGGRTWDESRLVVEKYPFWGDSTELLYFGRHRLAGSPRDFSTASSERFNRAAQKRAARRGGGDVGGAEGGGETRGAAANVNFGIGVPGGAPRLQLLVRKFGKPTSGLNLKQLLLMRGTRVPEVRIIVIHPHDEKTIFACTMYGLFVSRDGGLNWIRTFTGTTFLNGVAMGQRSFHVAVDPTNGNKILLATGEGLYISKDRGRNFLKATGKGVGEGVIDWIYFNPYDSKVVFVGTDYGMLRSKDGGENFEYIYFTTFPDGRVVRSIILDPFDRKRGYIATHDGLYQSSDMVNGGLESWQRLGGLKFTGMATSKIAACPKHKGHMWTLTNMMLNKTTVAGKWDTGGAFIYETIDGGLTWKIIYSGHTNGSMQWFTSDPSDPDMLWFIWSRAIQRMRRPELAVTTPPKNVVPPDDPPLGEMMMAAYNYSGSSPGQLLHYRRLSRLKALVPKVQATYIQGRWDVFSLLHDARYRLPYYRQTRNDTTSNEFRVMINWDLRPLIFNLDTVMFGRVDRVNADQRGWVHREIQHFYGEFRRLRQLMAFRPPKDQRVRLMYKLRIEELTSYLNFISGNYLARYWEGDHPRGLDTKWYKRWKLKDPSKGWSIGPL